MNVMQPMGVPNSGINLFKVQEQLKDMPQQAVMAYANGMNPGVVPPYVALGEMERRTRIEKGMQGDATPQGTVKDNLEAQIGRTVGTMGVGMPQGAPQGMPQGMPMGAPNQMQQGPQQQPAPTMMAAGGLASVPLRNHMARFAAGGITGVDEEPDYGGGGDEAPTGGDWGPDGPGQGAQGVPMPPEGATPQQNLAWARAQLSQQMGTPTVQTPSPTDIAAAYAKANPEAAARMQRPIGQEYLQGLQALQARQAQADQQSKGEDESRRRLGFYRALIDAGEATRGNRGLGGLFGGFGKSMGNSMEQDLQRAEGLRGEQAKREMIMLKAKQEIEQLQRAKDTGDMKAMQHHAEALAKLENEARKANMSAAWHAVTSAGALAGKQVAGDSATQSATIRTTGRSADVAATNASRERVAATRPHGSGRSQAKDPEYIKNISAEAKQKSAELAKDKHGIRSDADRATMQARIDTIRKELAEYAATGVVPTTAPVPTSAKFPGFTLRSVQDKQ